MQYYDSIYMIQLLNYIIEINYSANVLPQSMDNIFFSMTTGIYLLNISLIDNSHK